MSIISDLVGWGTYYETAGYICALFPFTVYLFNLKNELFYKILIWCLNGVFLIKIKFVIKILESNFRWLWINCDITLVNIGSVVFESQVQSFRCLNFTFLFIYCAGLALRTIYYLSLQSTRITKYICHKIYISWVRQQQNYFQIYILKHCDYRCCHSTHVQGV